MHRELYTSDHERYRETVRAFLAREVEPHRERWDEEREIDRSVYTRAARTGLYALGVPEQYGGAGETDYRYRMVVHEEVARIGANSFGMTLALQDDLVLAYLLDATTEDQRKRWLPGVADGTLIGALAMTEPGTGSDLQGIRTSARRDGPDDGSEPDADWILDGAKTFISSGSTADLVIVAARTDPDAGSRGFTLFVVEEGMAGFTRGRKLKKMGMAGQDTAELFFDGVRVPATHVLGGPGQGMRLLMSHLPQERLGIISVTFTVARAAYEQTARYCFERRAFGQAIGDFQNTRFTLAEIETELDVAQSYVDRCVTAFNAGELTPVEAAKGKWFVSELSKRVVDRCVQLHGGYGYMLEYPVARAYVDGRGQTIWAGSTEIMKEIVGRDIARRHRP